MGKLNKVFELNTRITLKWLTKKIDTLLIFNYKSMLLEIAGENTPSPMTMQAPSNIITSRAVFKLL